MSDKNYRMAAYCLILVIVFVLTMVAIALFSAARGPSLPAVVPMSMPMPDIAPVVIVERQTYRERVPAGPNTDLGFLPRIKHHPARSSCDAECMAYRKAYANAKRANALLGEPRYDEGPRPLVRIGRHTL